MIFRSTLSSLATEVMLAKTRSAIAGNAGVFARLTLDGTTDHTAPPRIKPSFGPVSGMLLLAKQSATDTVVEKPHTAIHKAPASLSNGARL